MVKRVLVSWGVIRRLGEKEEKGRGAGVKRDVRNVKDYIDWFCVS